MLNIEKIFSIHDPAIEYRNETPYLNWEGNNIRIIDLAQHLKVTGLIETNETNSKGNGETRTRQMKSREKVILWERAGKRIGIKVTRVVENKEIVTKQLDKVYSHLKGFLGATILGYDQVALILDPDTLEDLR